MSYFNEEQLDAMKDQAEQRCKATQQCLNDAAGHLIAAIPEGWEIHVVFRRNEAEMTLFDPEGEDVSSEWCCDYQDVKSFLYHAIDEYRRGR